MYNEVEKGNLVRCLKNVKQWADDIVIYDDASTDDSVEVARKYTKHILQGSTNNFEKELYNKQALLEYALTLRPNWIVSIDCDEILDSIATNGGLRRLANTVESSVDAVTFNLINLWRSETYARVDGDFDKFWRCRLWRVTNGISFSPQPGLHKRLCPSTIKNEIRTYLQFIHYGYANYNDVVVKHGFDNFGSVQFQEAARRSWIFNEEMCECYEVPLGLFPTENRPTTVYPRPQAKRISELVAYSGGGNIALKQYDASYWRQRK